MKQRKSQHRPSPVSGHAHPGAVAGDVGLGAVSAAFGGLEPRDAADGKFARQGGGVRSRGGAAGSAALVRLPAGLLSAWRRTGVVPARHLLVVSVAAQRMRWLEQAPAAQRAPGRPGYRLRRIYRISTSRFGTGQVADSNRTPLGLHQIAAKIGAGHPVGTVFVSRRAVGYTWQGHPRGAIAHRILWLQGLEEGFNRGGNVDSFRRYIYIHGLANEPSLGRPASCGCIHLAAADLIPLFDKLPTGTQVWIGER